MTVTQHQQSKWAILDDNDNDDESQTANLDSLDAYLGSPPIPKSEIKAVGPGGVLKYWENAHMTCPRLAQMALNFLSAPSMGFSFCGYEFRTYRCFVASSVDAEQPFSGGRLQVNHLQHQINSQSFKAQVAVGSWYSTPITKTADL